MLKRFMMMGLLSISVIVTLAGEVKAQYSYIGGNWIFNTYSHVMRFKVPGSVINQNELAFASNVVMYDNQFICKNNGGNITFNPGIGQFTVEGSAQAFLQSPCTQKQSGAECTATVVYFNSVAELLSDSNLLSQCRDAVGNQQLTAQECFLAFYGLEDFHCRNKNDTLIEFRTKGLCTTADAETCTDPTDPSTCTIQKTQGVRYTFANFNPPAGASFDMTLDDDCVACVQGDSNACLP